MAATNPAPLAQVLVVPFRDGWVHMLSDWRAVALGDGDAWLPGWAEVFDTALEAPVASGWRGHVAVSGLVFALSVHRSPPRLALGSPHMAVERQLLVSSGTVAAADAAEFAALEVLLALWDSADERLAPLAVEQAALAPLAALPLPAEARALVESRALDHARQLDVLAAEYRPTFREKAAQDALSLLEAHPQARVALLRLVAALPATEADTGGTVLQGLSSQALAVAAADATLPSELAALLRLGAGVAASLPARWLPGLARTAVEPVARQFLAGVDMADAAASLDALQAGGCEATIDRLGELVVTDSEADVYVRDVTQILRATAARHPPGARNAAGQLRAHVSLKCSALCPVYDPDDPERVWRAAGPRLLSLLRVARDLQVCVQLDAEHRPVRDLTLLLLRRALAVLDAEPSAQPLEAGIVVQAYLRDAGQHLAEVLDLARDRKTPLAIRLVKGAYWDAETLEAAAHQRLPEQFLAKPETDLQFQRLTVRLIEASAMGGVRVAIASHNLRDHVFAIAARELQHPGAPHLEHQVLLQTATSLAHALQAAGHAVRVYVPVGSLLMGMAYLVRRILENSSQVGVLTLTRHAAPLQERLQSPGLTLQRLRHAGKLPQPQVAAGFGNTPPLQLHEPQARAAFEHALRERAVLTVTESGHTGDWLDITSPCDSALLVGRIRSAQLGDVATLVGRAAEAQPAWESLGPAPRARSLWRAALVTRAHRLELAARICAEAGKPRAEALADVDEAADFLHFYAECAVADSDVQRTAALGVVAVVAPWNFPLAIAVGMAAAALVSGNAVVLKSAESTPLVIGLWLQRCREAGLWGDALLHLVGPGEPIGAALVADPRVAGVSFTGSRRVGEALQRLVATTPGPNAQPRRLVAELGGKNAVVVGASADLDEAVTILLRSAFGHAGQKCSAASRAIVDRRVAPQLLRRLVEAAAALHVGPGWAPGTQLGPVIRSADQQRLQGAAKRCWQEWLDAGGDPAAPHCDRSVVAADGAGWYVGPVVVPATVAQALDPASTLHQEHFGPILQVVAVADEAEAIRVCNAPGYALTAGVVSQDPAQVERLIHTLRAGNVYVNRSITGARVAVEPFGGFGWSGSGPKAGSRLALAPWRRPHVGPQHPVWLTLPPTCAGQATWAWARPDGALLADAIQRAARLPEAVDLLDATALATLGWLVRHLPPALGPGRTMQRETVALPAQRTHHLWLRPRGPVLIVAAERHDGAFGLLQAAAALLCGCPVVVLPQHEAALQRWQRWQGWWALDPDDALQICALDPAAQAALLAESALATVVVDSAAPPPTALLACWLAPREGAPQARQLISPALSVLGHDIERWLQLHALPTVVAENTLRHGAALDVPTVQLS